MSSGKEASRIQKALFRFNLQDAHALIRRCREKQDMVLEAGALSLEITYKFVILTNGSGE
jgi:hypothetical protein